MRAHDLAQLDIGRLLAATGRLEHLKRHGPTPSAFTFRQRFGVTLDTTE